MYVCMYVCIYIYIQSHTHLQAKLKEAEAGVGALEAASKEHIREHETLLQGLQGQLEAKDKRISDLQVRAGRYMYVSIYICMFFY